MFNSKSTRLRCNRDKTILCFYFYLQNSHINFNLFPFSTICTRNTEYKEFSYTNSENRKPVENNVIIVQLKVKSVNKIKKYFHMNLK
jgi:hypothetical protein